MRCKWSLPALCFRSVVSPVVFLGFCWIVGILCGMHFVSFAIEPFSSLMRAGIYCRVTFVGLLAALLLPLFFSAISVYFSVPRFQYFVCFLKAFCFGCCLYCCMHTFGSAGWLIMAIMMLSDCSMLTPLLWFWCRHISGDKQSLKRDIYYCLTVAALVGTVDYFIISPYLVGLLKYF